MERSFLGGHAGSGCGVFLGVFTRKMLHCVSVSASAHLQRPASSSCGCRSPNRITELAYDAISSWNTGKEPGGEFACGDGFIKVNEKKKEDEREKRAERYVRVASVIVDSATE